MPEVWEQQREALRADLHLLRHAGTRDEIALVSYTHLDVYKRQGQHRTILSVESRRQIFWQVIQKCSRILCVFAGIFVTVAGKSASEVTLKAVS